MGQQSSHCGLLWMPINLYMKRRTVGCARGFRCSRSSRMQHVPSATSETRFLRVEPLALARTSCPPPDDQGVSLVGSTDLMSVRICRHQRTLYTTRAVRKSSNQRRCDTCDTLRGLGDRSNLLKLHRLPARSDFSKARRCLFWRDTARCSSDPPGPTAAR